MTHPVDTAQPGKITTFRYVGLNSQGGIVKGTITALNQVEAEDHLAERGYESLRVEVAPSRWSLEEMFPTFFQIKPREVIVFSRQLATLIESGVTLISALELVLSQAGTTRVFKRIIRAIIDDLRTGNSFSQAIDRHPHVFSQIYIRTVTVGERTGRIETVLKQMADYMEQQGVLAQKFTRALMYPMTLLVVAVLVGGVLVTTALPPMLDMFSNMNVDLPLPTRMLMAFSGFLSSARLFLLLLLVAVVAGVVYLLKAPQGRRYLDRLRLTVPLLGPPILMGEIGRLSRAMSVLAGAGLPLQEIMALMPQTTTNTVIRDALLRLHEGLLMGEGLSGPMSEFRYFPPLMVQMTAVGEESNSLDFTLGVVANFYESASQERLSALVGLITPTMTIGMALVVGFIAMAVIMPMYSLTGAIGG
ncbi:MAG: type II secretion system F family protein [Dehalococcoidia bacterium]